MFKLIRLIIKYTYFFLFLIVTLLPITFFIFLHDIQFLPLILRIINFFSLSAIIIFIIIIITTLVFGRYYCQYLCPFGIFQDILPSYNFRNKISSFFENKKVKFFLRLTFFVIVIFGIFIYFEPYSFFTKIIVYPIKTVFYLLYNFILKLFKNFNIYLSPLKYNIDLSLFYINLIILFILLILNLVKKRFFCNFICPSGTLLNCMSTIPLFGIKFNDKCISCGICEKSCPTMAIDNKNKDINNGECVLCMKCTECCKYSGISYTILTVKDFKNNRQKRNLIFVFLAIVMLFVLKKIGISLNKFFISKSKKDFISPPGSKSFENLSSKCISCSLCIIQCPTKVIRFENYLPFLDYSKKYCLYECKICSEVCPVDAIEPITISEKKITQIGYSIFNLKTCIVYTDETDCGACSEHCPTKAVYMVDYKNGLLIPEINKEICIGCGACQYACPSVPKSIIVKANIIHKKVMSPDKIREENRDELDKNFNEFPF